MEERRQAAGSAAPCAPSGQLRGRLVMGWPLTRSANRGAGLGPQRTSPRVTKRPSGEHKRKRACREGGSSRVSAAVLHLDRHQVTSS